MKIDIKQSAKSYDVIVERGCLDKAAELLNLDRKCLVVTDDGVPDVYYEKAAEQCRDAILVKVPQGEASKSIESFELLLSTMLEKGFTRGDAVIAVGGGVAGDLAGFAASAYMRGIDFYNIPTTLLSQADSSIGGKTGVNLGGVKNIVGAFWQPSAVLIDADTLATLSEEQYASGMAEIIKAGMIQDAELLNILASEDDPDPEKLLLRALAVKKQVVEEDEREGNLRRILNFGHTIGHGIESVTGMLHGHAVALGMIPMCSDEARTVLLDALKKAGLPTEVKCDADAVYKAVLSDKKMKAGRIGTVWVDKPGSFEIREVEPEELMDKIRMIVS